jgi:hypothetical protein
MDCPKLAANVVFAGVFYGARKRDILFLFGSNFTRRVKADLKIESWR